MKIFLFIWLLAFVFPSQAQVYRCGNEYSSQPCKGGKEVDVSPQVSDPEGPRKVTLYLCSAGTRYYWISERCATRGWTLERTELVSARASFDDQVAEAKSKQAAAVAAASARVVGSTNGANFYQQNNASNKRAQCDQLDQRINDLDSKGRMGSTHYNLEWIREERRKARDEQFRLRC